MSFRSTFSGAMFSSSNLKLKSILLTLNIKPFLSDSAWKQLWICVVRPSIHTSSKLVTVAEQFNGSSPLPLCTILSARLSSELRRCSEACRLEKYVSNHPFSLVTVICMLEKMGNFKLSTDYHWTVMCAVTPWGLDDVVKTNRVESGAPGTSLANWLR